MVQPFIITLDLISVYSCIFTTNTWIAEPREAEVTGHKKKVFRRPKTPDTKVESDFITRSIRSKIKVNMSVGTRPYNVEKEQKPT